MTSAIRLSPSRSAALALVAAGHVRASTADPDADAETGRGYWFADRSPGGRRSRPTPAAPLRWLLTHGYASIRASAVVPTGLGWATLRTDGGGA